MPGPIVSRIRCVWSDGTIPPVYPLPIPEVAVGIACDAVVQLDFVSGNGVAFPIDDATIVFSAGIPGNDLLVSRAPRPDLLTEGRCYVDIYQADTLGLLPHRYDMSVECTVDGIRQPVTLVGTLSTLRTVGTITATTDASVGGAGTFSRTYKHTVTQAEIDAGVPVNVPTAFIPTGAIAIVASGANISDLASCDGIHAYVTLSIESPPLNAGDIVIITAVE